MNFNPMAFIDNLYYMGVGMAAILAVIVFLIEAVMILNILTSIKLTKKK